MRITREDWRETNENHRLTATVTEDNGIVRTFDGVVRAPTLKAAKEHLSDVFTTVVNIVYHGVIGGCNA